MAVVFIPNTHANGTDVEQYGLTTLQDTILASLQKIENFAVFVFVAALFDTCCRIFVSDCHFSGLSLLVLR